MIHIRITLTPNRAEQWDKETSHEQLKQAAINVFEAALIKSALPIESFNITVE